MTCIGAFTPGCSAKHLPGYIQNLPKLRSKGIDIVAVIAFNDPYVMSAWGKANGIKGDDIVSIPFVSRRDQTKDSVAHKLTPTLLQLFLTDNEAKFSKSIGWTKGERTGRYVIVIDHGKVIYAENEPGSDVTVSFLNYGTHYVRDVH